MIKNLFEVVWNRYKLDEGKYNKEYVFKHWILITMTTAFSKNGWDTNAWFNKLMSDKSILFN